MALRIPFLALGGAALLALSGCAVAPPGAYLTGTTVYDSVAVPDPYGYGYGGYGYGGYGYGSLGYTGLYGGPAYYGPAPGYYGGPRYGVPWYGRPSRPSGTPVPPVGFGGPRPAVAPLGTLPPPQFGVPSRGGGPARFVPRGGGRR